MDTEADAPAIVSLTRTDIPAIHALYLRALSAVPNPGAVRPDEPSFFEWAFDVGGEILGMREGKELLAYGVLRPELESERDRAGLHRYAGQREGLRVLDGSAVRPADWKRGWQRRIILARVAKAAALGAAHVIAKASPGNTPSLRNLLQCGFATVGLIEKPYGWRYVQHRPVSAPVEPPVEGCWVKAARIDEASARFRAGEAAFVCHLDEDGEPSLRFGAHKARR